MVELEYDKQCHYVAHNRYGKQIGIRIDDMGVGVIRLRPMNTRDTLPPCTMQIPVENLQEFIDELQKLV